MWQDVRTQLHPRGVEIVTVGMDTAGPEACRQFIEAADPQHPSLVDVGHLMAERFGVVNIPNGIWIDEDGMVVRPAEPAWPPGMPARPRADSDAPIPEHMQEIFAEASKISVDREAYGRALLDWVEHGAASRFVLSPDEVVARSTRRDLPSAEAAAHFGLAHLHHRDQPHAIDRGCEQDDATAPERDARLDERFGREHDDPDARR